jgi:transglutaminase-like putative cysteine protease
MAVMARTLGIPARGDRLRDRGVRPGRGAYLIHQSDAHAWPELYIDGRWLPFEPTRRSARCRRATSRGRAADWRPRRPSSPRG